VKNILKKINGHKTLIVILAISIPLLISFLILSYVASSTLNADIETMEIYHNVLKNKVFISRVPATLFGSHDIYMISTYKKTNNENFYDSTRDYIFQGENSLLYYYLTDSSIMFFVNQNSKIPTNFNSNIKIEQFEMYENRKFVDSMIHEANVFRLKDVFPFKK
jgi:hypothetical protein